MSLSNDLQFDIGTDYKSILNRHEIVQKEDPETHVIILEEHRYVELDDNKVDITPAEVMFGELPETMYLFATNYNGIATDTFVGRISEVTIEINNSVVHNYIACRDRFTSQGGVYDTIDDIFYGNLGNGLFIIGPDVNPISDEMAINYEIADELKDQPVRGWLPKDTKRNNLQQLLFSYNVNFKRTETGDPYFMPLYSTHATEEVKPIHTYSDGSVNYGSPASEIEIVSHGYKYISGYEPEELYNNLNDVEPANNHYVEFPNAPISTATLKFTDLIVHYYNCNGAYVSGFGKIEGVPYKDYSYTDTVKNDLAYEDNVISVGDATLISSINSINVATRLISYYRDSKIITNNIVLNGEHCGNMYKITDPFDEEREIFLAKVSMNVSSNIKAACNMIEGYDPAGVAGIFSHAELLTGSGTWNTPQEILDLGEDGVILVAIFQGGQGGESGADGDPGGARGTLYGSSTNHAITGGKGGVAGRGGLPGKVLIQTIRNPNSSYNYSCGEGGDGGSKYERIQNLYDSYGELPEPDYTTSYRYYNVYGYPYSKKFMSYYSSNNRYEWEEIVELPHLYSNVYKSASSIPRATKQMLGNHIIANKGDGYKLYRCVKNPLNDNEYYWETFRIMDSQYQNEDRISTIIYSDPDTLPIASETTMGIGYIVDNPDHAWYEDKVSLYYSRHNRSREDIVPIERYGTNYILIDYVQSNGNQIINTDFYDTDGFIIDIMFSWNSISGWNIICGNVNNSSSGTEESVISCGNSSRVSIHLNTTKYYGPTAKANTIYHCIADFINGEQSFSVDDTAVSVSQSTYTHASVPIGLFGDYNGNGQIANRCSAKIYYCKIYDSNHNLVRDYIPVRHSGNNQIGFLDKVHDVFYTNSGSGSFTAGPTKGEYGWYCATNGVFNTIITKGKEGTHSIFGEYSSENGSILQNGYMNFTNGELYGTYGKDGIPGGRGGNRPGINNGAIREGEDVFYNGVLYKGGKSGSNASSSYAIAEGGCGGGAAAGSVGGKGRDSYGSTIGTIDNRFINPIDNSQDGAYYVFCFADPGYGGKGADAIKPDDAIFPGEGGHGGNGGGGAGQGGYAMLPKDYNDPYYVYLVLPDGQTGGARSEYPGNHEATAEK